MTPMQTDRPRFYEQQYLDAADLSALVDYERIARARHDLGAHSWGIASGLQLTEKPANGGLDVYLQPGYAWDGLGRSLVVLAPYRLPIDLFRSIAFTAGIDDGATPGRLVDVWLAFTATPRGGPADGFATCTSDDQSSRLFESFRVVIGERPAHADRHVPVTVGAFTVDAEQVTRRLGSATDPLLADESVAFQSFPDAWDTAQWLVPLGYVRWVPPQNTLNTGAFGTRTPGDLALSDRRRRYAGVVAETVDAARGFVRIRSRDAASYAPTVWNTTTDTDLLWVEGNARVQGDIKLLGGRVTWRDAANADIGGPLTIQRRVTGAASDLCVQIGDSDTGSNRLVVGPITGGALRERFVVTAAGRVGVGVPEPAAAPLVIRAQGGSEDLMAFETPGGAASWKLNTLPGGQAGLNFTDGVVDSRLFLQNGGNVGIGTTDPKHRVEVHGENNALVLISDATAGVAANMGIELRTKSASGVSYIDFTKGNTDVADSGTPDFNARLSYNYANTGALAMQGAPLGIGTLTPTHRLHVEDVSGMRVNQMYLSGGLRGNGRNWQSVTFNAHHNAANDAWVFPDTSRHAVTIEMDDYFGGIPRFEVYTTKPSDKTDWTRHFAIRGDTGNVVMNDQGGRTGVGVTTPLCRLHVVGDSDLAPTSVLSHVALIENTNNANNSSVLALRVADVPVTRSNNFITFFSGGGSVGSIEGNTNGIGVRLNSGAADYAEWLPRDEDEAPMQPGDLVGVFGGKLRRSTEGADHLMVISTAPAVLANTPAEALRDQFECVAMLGQAPVRVRGVVTAGDVIVPSGEADGTGIAVAAAKATLDDFAACVGTAWESSSTRGIASVRIAVGLVSAAAWRSIGRALTGTRVASVAKRPTAKQT